MQNSPHPTLEQRQQDSPEADPLAGAVRAGLNRRGTAPTDIEVARLVRALSRLQPAGLSALSSSPPTNGHSGNAEKPGSATASPDIAFLTTLQSLTV